MPLRQLKAITLIGESNLVFGLLQRLELPAALDHMQLVFLDTLVEDMIRNLGSYTQNRLRRDIGFREKLVVTCDGGDIDVDTYLEGTSEIACTPTFIIKTNDSTSNLTALVPCEHVVDLEMGRLGMGEELFIAMSNIETLRLRDVSLRKGFLQPDPTGPHANVKLLPSLRNLQLDVVTVPSWRPLVDYLVHQTSNHQAISLKLECFSCKVPLEVIKEVEGLVGEFSIIKRGVELRSGEVKDGLS